MASPTFDFKSAGFNADVVVELQSPEYIESVDTTGAPKLTKSDLYRGVASDAIWQLINVYSDYPEVVKHLEEAHSILLRNSPVA